MNKWLEEQSFVTARCPYFEMSNELYFSVVMKTRMRPYAYVFMLMLPTIEKNLTFLS
jgi:hypothetical protein